MTIAVCLFVRNEAQFLPEWVAYHSVVGFEAFLIYDNRSDDAAPAVLGRLSRNADVRPLTWDRTDVYAQRSAYEHALARHKTEFEWMLFIDTDEFFTPVVTDTVQGFVSSVPSSQAVALNWAMFGSSGHVDAPTGLVVESYVHRAGDHFPHNDYIKTLVRPEAVNRIICPHVVEVEGGYTDAMGRPAQLRGQTLAPPQLEVCRINHYFTRSRADWRAKVARGYRDIARSDEDFDAFDRNNVRDEAALRFAPRVRDRLTGWDLKL